MHPQRSTNELLKPTPRRNFFIAQFFHIKAVPSLLLRTDIGLFSFLSEPDSFTLGESFPLNLRFPFGRDCHYSVLFLLKRHLKLCAFTERGSILEQLFYPGSLIVFCILQIQLVFFSPLLSQVS